MYKMAMQFFFSFLFAGNIKSNIYKFNPIIQTAAPALIPALAVIYEVAYYISCIKTVVHR